MTNEIEKHQHLLMAVKVLRQLALPKEQQTDLCGNVLLALCSLEPDGTWKDVTNQWVRIHEIILFLGEKYGVHYAENSRETIRKQALHHFRNAAMIEDNGMATNSPKYRYRLTQEFCLLLRAIETQQWGTMLEHFNEKHEALCQQYASKRELQKMPVKINNDDFVFSPGEHNQLQKAIIEEFAPRFAPGCECLYVGDTVKKDLFINRKKMNDLGFSLSVHDKMPDVILYRADKNWLYFIEAVTSVGPMAPKRIQELQDMSANVCAGKIFITAFLNLNTYKNFIEQIAWETEIWIAEMPDHMIHLDGHRFLGPYSIDDEQVDSNTDGK